MLMCAVGELEAGWAVGGAVLHPKRPSTQLLAPNTALTRENIRTLQRLGVEHVWITGDDLEDYDRGATRLLTREQHALQEALLNDFAGRAKTTISTASVQKYKQRVNQLIMSAISSRQYASLASRLRTGGDGQFAHAANVAYLCVVCGLQLETYIVRERPRLTPGKALDHASLGLAGLLHDVGKTNCDFESRQQHEVHLHEDDDEEAYRDHVQIGYEMLEYAGAPASVRVAVRMHHQRWDGAGWPDADACGLRHREAVVGSDIHIYSRIVGAANVLDNLLHRADGTPSLPVSALARFASTEFDGWFDPMVRAALLRAVQPYAVGSRVVLTDGTVCAVVLPNPACPCLPSVKPLDNQHAGEVINLSNDASMRRIARHEGQDVSSLYYEPTPASVDGDDSVCMVPPMYIDPSDAAA